MTKITPKEKFNLANRIMLDKTLSPATRLVGWYIADHIHTVRGYAWPAQVDIARDLGIDLRSVKRAVKSLAPYFKIDRRGRANEYRIGAKLSPMEAGDRGQKRPGKVTKTSEIGDKKDPPSLEILLHPLTTSTGVDGARFKKRKRNRQEKAASANGLASFGKAIRER